jgi:hypothetical protein
MSAFQFAINWNVDIIDAPSANPAFLIHSAGANQPYTNIFSSGSSPPAGKTLGVIAGSPYFESGSGVLARWAVEGKAVGFAELSLAQWDSEPTLLPAIYDSRNELIPFELINGAQIAVAKDGSDAGSLVGDSPGELFTCNDHDADGISNAGDNCPTQPEDFNGVQDGDGCPESSIDSDGDGINDGADACPQTPGVFERMGCPVPAVGGIAGLLDASEPQRASRPSRDESASLEIGAAVVGVITLLAGSSLALRARRGR